MRNVTGLIKNKTRITTRIDDLIKMIKEGVKTKEIAEHFDCHYVTINYWRRKINESRLSTPAIERLPNKVFSRKQVLDIYKAKGTYQEIAEKYQISSRTVLHIKTGQIYKDITGGRNNGNTNRNYKLSKSVIEKIKKEITSRKLIKGVTIKAIAKKYNVSEHNVMGTKQRNKLKWKT